jgi:AcrR family transcriptional regulator
MSLSRHRVSIASVAYTGTVPKLWSDTIEAHRHDVRDAILETTAALVAEHGVRPVTMLQIAEKTGIGRATLYKYFPDVESILIAWHEGHVGAHLEHLAMLRDQAGDAGKRLRAVLEGYALIQHEHHGHGEKAWASVLGSELVLFLHRGEHVARAQRHLTELIRDLLKECARTGEVRKDVAADELASYCIHALSAASGLPSKTAVRRLVAVTLAGLRPPR